MGKGLRWALVTLSLGLVACTALLGDFTVGMSDAGDTGAPDVGTDGMDAGDASDGAPLPRLACTASVNRLQVTNASEQLYPALVRVAALPMDMERVVLADYPFDDAGNPNLTLRAYTFNNMSLTGSVPDPVGIGQALAVERYETPLHSGFAVLVYVNNVPTDGGSATGGTLYMTRFPDDQSTWTTPVAMFAIPTNYNQLEADFSIIDSESDDYFVAYDTFDGTTELVMGGEWNQSASTHPGPGMLAMFPATMGGRAPYSLQAPAVAYRSNVGYAFLSVNGDNGPPMPGAKDILANTASNINVTPPMTLNYFPIGFTNAADPLRVNTGFLIANLGNLTGNYGIGQVTSAALGMFNPGSLPVTTVTSSDGGPPALKDLFVGGRAIAHWDTIPSAPLVPEQLVYVTATVDPVSSMNFGGMNFGWWDGPSGALRAYQAGDAHLFGDIFFTDADVAVVGLTGVIGEVTAAWLQVPTAPNGNNSIPPPPADLWIGGIGCE